MRKRFFIGAALLSVMLAGFPVIEPVAAETTPEEATPVTDNRKPHAGGFIRFNGFRHNDGKHVTYPNLSAMNEVGTETAARTAHSRPFDLYGHIDIEEQARIIDYPILSVSEGEMTAFELSVPYHEADVEILGTSSPMVNGCIAYHVCDNELHLRWMRRTPANVHKGDTLALLKLYLKHRPNTHINRYFNIDPAGYHVTCADGRADKWQIALPAVRLHHAPHAMASHMTDSAWSAATASFNRTNDCQAKRTLVRDPNETMLKQQGGSTNSFEILSVIPNPMKSWADITYSILGECTIRLRLYSLLGEEIMTLVNSGRQTGLYRHNITNSDVAAGVYILRLETCQEDVNVPSDIMKVVIQND